MSLLLRLGAVPAAAAVVAAANSLRNSKKTKKRNHSNVALSSMFKLVVAENYVL